MMRATVLRHARCKNPDRLTLEYRERHGTEVEHDMVNIALDRCIGETVVADDGRRGGCLLCVQIHIGLRRRPWWHARTPRRIDIDTGGLVRDIHCRARRIRLR
jgi:hypothetical protein